MRSRARLAGEISTHALREEGDHHAGRYREPQLISTHALREEGDIPTLIANIPEILFLPTPSARRATDGGIGLPGQLAISTHALREEGDSCRPAPPSAW